MLTFKKLAKYAIIILILKYYYLTFYYQANNLWSMMWQKSVLPITSYYLYQSMILIERYSQQREKRQANINYLVNSAFLLFYRLNNHARLEAVLGRKKM